MAADLAPFYNGEIDVYPGFVINEPDTIRRAGYEVNVILASDYGVNEYADVLFTTEEMIDQNPDLVRRFVRAMLQGWEYAIEHPTETVDAVMEHTPNSDRGHQEAMLETTVRLVRPGGFTVGAMDAAVWQKMADTLLEYGVISTPVDVANCSAPSFRGNRSKGGNQSRYVLLATRRQPCHEQRKADNVPTPSRPDGIAAKARHARAASISTLILVAAAIAHRGHWHPVPIYFQIGAWQILADVRRVVLAVLCLTSRPTTLIAAETGRRRVLDPRRACSSPTTAGELAFPAARSYCLPSSGFLLIVLVASVILFRASRRIWLLAGGVHLASHPVDQPGSSRCPASTCRELRLPCTSASSRSPSYCCWPSCGLLQLVRAIRGLARSAPGCLQLSWAWSWCRCSSSVQAPCSAWCKGPCNN